MNNLTNNRNSDSSHMSRVRLIDDDDANYVPPFTDLTTDQEVQHKYSKIAVARSNYKWDLHLELKQFRAFKNWTVSKVSEFDRFIRNGFVPRRRSEPKTCWNELHADVDDLIDFRRWAQEKIAELEGKIMGDVDNHAQPVDAVATPVTGEKVKRRLQREFDDDKMCSADNCDDDIVTVPPRKLMKAKTKKVVEKMPVLQAAQCEDDVIGIEDVTCAHRERLCLRGEEGEEEIVAVEEVIGAQDEEEVPARSARDNHAEHAELISMQRESRFNRLTFSDTQTQPPK